MRFPTTILLGLSLLGALPLAAVAADAPTCAEGYVSTPLKSALTGFVCLDTYSADSLRDNLQSLKNQLATDDIKTILEPLAADANNADFSEDFQNSNRVRLERAKDYAAKLCERDATQPQVQIPSAELYDGFGLTPTCTVSPLGAKPNSVTNISVSFLDATGAQKLYSSNSDSFTGFTADATGTGAHTVTCSYRPNYCEQARVASKTVNVTAPAKTQLQTHSIARRWNEVILDAIRTDLVRPPVQARNLFHFSAALYDIWALDHPGTKTYLVNAAQAPSFCKLKKWQFVGLTGQSTEEEAMSYAAYSLIKARYTQAPGYADTMEKADTLMSQLGYDINFTPRRDTPHHRAAALGNAVADCYLRYGLTDGSNEAGSHTNTAYQPRNELINPKTFGNSGLKNWDSWQPIGLETFVDQGGNTVTSGAADFMGAEWGSVKPFALRADQKQVFKRDGHAYPVYLDPPAPPPAEEGKNAEYKWNFGLVGAWSSHLDPTDGVLWDVSPGKLGNTPALPTTWAGLHDFYDLKNGGTKALGRAANPKTGQPYAPQIVPRGDYTRALAEFWADGPNSETPPGHWFFIFNTVSDNPLLAKKLWGQGATVDALEWDVKGYFTLGGAVHDAAIAAWGAKGWYDGIRPISAIRAMAEHGQSSDKNLPSYDPQGLPLIPGYFELIAKGDPLAGRGGKNIGKVKMRAWRGPGYIPDPESDTAGVGWILAGNWWPYQRPSFVTPPFGGYISGHSTFSRAAAEVLTSFTGDAYFPGGLYEIALPASNYLVFENGPSKDIKLQYATYQDAADSCSLSRIWGGIHPPVDDVPGRLLGEKVGKQAVEYARGFFGK